MFSILLYLLSVILIGYPLFIVRNKIVLNWRFYLENHKLMAFLFFPLSYYFKTDPLFDFDLSEDCLDKFSLPLLWPFSMIFRVILLTLLLFYICAEIFYNGILYYWNSFKKLPSKKDPS